MPLPPALAARLAKRGILNSQEAVPHVEEVIAEDYDDRKSNSTNVVKITKTDDGEFNPEEIQYKIKGYPGCPNKYNIYHECQQYCKDKYGNGFNTPDSRYVSRKNKMLAKYPLPDNWQEIYDPGTGRFYYWEIKTDLVSWLPPGHPRHVATEAAAVLREEVRLAETDEEESDSDEDNTEPEDDGPTEKEKKQQQIEQMHARGRSKKKENDLDPMDPASYSDIPRGSWSSGLMVETKSGVDSTVSGPLYQQRPYPSPGDVLRRKGKPPPKKSVSFPEPPPP